MREERKPVMCPWCGGEMVKMMGLRFNQSIGTTEHHGHYACQMCGSSAPESEYLTDLSAAEESAYAAAMKRADPENRVLTLEDVAAGNIAKLQKRYPDGFDTRRSVERSDQ